MEKFKTLVHYVVASCDDPQRLGATRLNKILWFADSYAFRLTGVPITQETYVKRQHGPVPKTILAVLRQLEEEGKIIIKQQEHPVYKTRLFISLSEPDTAVFSPRELGIVDYVVKDICANHTALSISDMSHDCVWDAANEGEILPLAATLVGLEGEVTNEVMAWADSVIEREGPNQQAA